MNKNDVVKNVAEGCGLTMMEAKGMVNFVFNNIKEHVKNYEIVSISGFGVFSPKQDINRRVRNVVSREEFTIAKLNRVTFKPSIKFKNYLNS